MKVERPTVVCVLGMSRSGTSLTARILNLSGVYLGPAEDLLWHRSSNPDGHWESRPMLRFNEWLLRSQGGNWREPPAPAPGWERSEALARERCLARRFLAETFGGHALWGWKDPRNCLTLPFWHQLLPELRHVICLRNPIDVAASLERREGISAARSFELWAAYVSAALAHTEGHPRAFVAYEDYFDPGRSPIARLVRFAGASPQPAGSAGAERIERTVKNGLRHHRTPAHAVLEDERVPSHVASAFLRLSDAESAPQEACRS